MEILSAKDLCKSYGSGENSVQALNHVSISVENGEFVAVIGTSGSGKSTLLNLLGGLDTPTSGEVLVSGKKLFQMNEEARTIFRRRNIGFVFQNYNLVPVLNVYENIVLPIELDGTKHKSGYRICENNSAHIGIGTKSTGNAKSAFWRAATTCCHCTGIGSKTGDSLGR